MLQYVLAFLAGILVKTVDWIEDDLKSKTPLKYLLAIAYGAIIGYLISVAPFSTIFLAAIIGQVFAKKFDTAAHMLGLFATILTIPLFGFPPLDLLLLGYFVVLAFLDELEYAGNLWFLERYRPFLKVGALPLLFLGKWEYFAGIILFDLGYELVYAITGRMGKKESSAPEPKAPEAIARQKARRLKSS